MRQYAQIDSSGFVITRALSAQFVANSALVNL